ncbi:MAG: methylated-DNA--[protein]-cysteine S-methyltransferase [Solirubrobacteraceae bacterium]
MSTAAAATMTAFLPPTTHPGPTLYTRMASPVGELLIVGDEQALLGVSMEDQRWGPELDPAWVPATEPFATAVRQLEQYFDGERMRFDLPLCATGTPFRVRAWSTLRDIPFGETRTYGDIALQLGKPYGARAVGLANGRNPFAIIVPCHRVIGAAGQLVGYGGGLERKRWLLRHEADVARATNALFQSSD